MHLKNIHLLGPIVFLCLIGQYCHLPLSKSANAAEGLQIRPGTVFNQDSDNGFPITGRNLADTKIEKGKPALIFFGASGDLNTNRQAKRLVEIYNKTPPKSLKFILVDVDHPINQESKNLIKNFYKGYIPFEVLISQNGQECWSQIGEVQTNILRKKIEPLISKDQPQEKAEN